MVPLCRPLVCTQLNGVGGLEAGERESLCMENCLGLVEYHSCLHMDLIYTDVPQRNTSNSRIKFRLLRTYSLALLVPEVILLAAFSQFLQARSPRASCSTAQKRRDSELAEPKNWYSTDNRSLERAQGLVNGASRVSAEWTLRQAFYVNVGGLALQTQDEWIYTVKQASDISFLIQASIISSSNLRKRDTEDRSKAGFIC